MSKSYVIILYSKLLFLLNVENRQNQAISRYPATAVTSTSFWLLSLALELLLELDEPNIQRNW